MGRVEFEDGSFAEVQKTNKGKFFLVVSARTPGSEDQKGDIVNSAELSKEQFYKLLSDINDFSSFNLNTNLETQTKSLTNSKLSKKTSKKTSKKSKTGDNKNEEVN